MPSMRRALLSCHPGRYLIVILVFSGVLLWFSEVFDNNLIEINPGWQSQPDHDHVHIRRRISLTKDFIVIRGVELVSINKRLGLTKFKDAKRLCNQANDTCLGFVNFGSRGANVFSLVRTPPTLRKGVNTIYLKPSRAGEISFERDFLQCVIPRQTNHSSSSGCKLPQLNPWDESIRGLIEPLKPMSCEGTLYTSYTNNVLKFVKPKDSSKIKSITYQTIMRPPDSDEGHLYGDEIPLKLDGTGEHLTEDFIEVNVYTNDGQSQRDFHANAAPKPQVLHRKNKHPNMGIPLNIIILGLDGNSNANFQRFLPESYKYLKDDLKAFIFEGFSDLGEATTPQLTGLLTGRTVEQNCAKHEARTGLSEEYVDAWPFIFKDFHEHAYATLFSEDAPRIGAFSLRLNGFQKQPADHYSRHFWYPFPSDDAGVHDNCINAQPQHMLQLKYLKSFIEAYPHHNKFGFTFLASLCHQSFNLVSSGAKDIHEFITWMNSSGHLDNTMLVVMGDHGARFDEIRSTLQGKLEERLPFLSMVLPKWFREKFPTFIKNLHENTKRIISPLDVHATFMHVLKYPKDPSKSAWTKGTSLFEFLPENRVCRDASIPTHFCPCLQFKSIDITNTHVLIGAYLTVEHINEKLAKEAETSRLCHKLVLSDIISAVQAMPNKNVQRFKSIDGGVGLGVGKPIYNEDQDIACTYEIQLKTKPNMAIYESTIKFVDGKFAVQGEISRVNRYGTQSYCITETHPYLRKYCLCRHF